MESRMDKYYNNNSNYLERSKRNAKLYKDVYNMSDLDNLPIPDNSNEIDMDGLKQIISNREDYRKVKQNSNRSYANEEDIQREDEPLQNGWSNENKVYDINVLLEEAKRSSIKKERASRELEKRSTNFLTSLEDANIPDNSDAIEVSQKVEEKVNTDSLPLDILMDLKGNDNTVVTDPIVKDEITMIKKVKDGETFYSGSFNFSKKDFEDEEMDNSFGDIKESNHTVIKVILLVLVLLALAFGIYYVLANYVL